jgi:hypothetical protein
MSVAKMMMTIRVPRGTAPTIDAIRMRYHLAPEDVDADFGVIAIDPHEGTYTVLVDERAVSKIRSEGDWEINGPFSSPRIDPTR